MNDVHCDVVVIGAGLTGLAAALFAVRRGLDTVLVGRTGALGFASGLLDLLGVHPVGGHTPLEDPWQGITALRADQPQHPYALLDNPAIEGALRTVLAFLAANGHPYITRPHRNQTVPTAVGTLKTTYALPCTMAPGAMALARRAPCLLVDFHGLKGYSARQIAATLAGVWPGLTPVRIAFPEAHGELLPERLARALDTVPAREKLVAAIGPHLADAAAVGLPAVLGFYHSRAAVADLEQGLGVPVFEIPTMLPAVGGLRLRELFESALPVMGVRCLWQQWVDAARRLPDGRWRFTVAAPFGAQHITARGAVVCSGRFFGKGLHADRHGIREPLFQLPVVQPPHRSDWHHKDLLVPDGHPINRAGVAVDNTFRPVDRRGRLVHDNLFAAGTLLAHQDWVRQKCGSGLAIATAYAAVRACAALI